MTENTTASGAADLPEFPGHPEPQIMMWNALEIVAIRKYGADMFRAGRLAASAPVAPTQPATPKGFVLVPVEATEDMKAAAVKYANGTAVYKNVAAAALRIEEGIYGEVYEAMIAAAPKAAPITDAEQAAWHAGLDEGRSQVRGAAQAAPSMDAKQLGDAVVKWLGCETTKPRGDTGEPERRIDVSVERLGFAVAALIAARGAAQPEGGAK